MNRLIYILIIIVVIAACDDFFDEDLSGKTVELVGPADGIETSSTSFTFWWNEVDGASKYNLQVVSPSFEAIEKLVLDTNLTETKYEYQLYPGSFQWRVMAFNGSSETEYTTYTLTVDSTLDLSTTTVILSAPDADYATSDTSVEFSWQSISIAEEYKIRLVMGDWETGSLKAEEETTDDYISLGLVSEGTYAWGVRAENIYSVSKYGISTLIIDRTDPQNPTLDSPDPAEEVDIEVTFSWIRNEDSGSPIVKDSLFISTDQDFTTDLEEIVSVETSHKKEFNVSQGSSQTYYWRVKSIDAAGNVSNYSSTREFTVKNEK